MNDLTMECGHCGGPVYMETCAIENGTTHEWVVASECQQCGIRHEAVDGCLDCKAAQ